MRLNDEELQKIKSVISSFLKDREGELRLYGSRVDDHKRGGDIDLVLIVPEIYPDFSSFEVVARLKEKIGDRRIDFTVLHRAKTSDPFWQLALESSQLIVLV